MRNGTSLWWASIARNKKCVTLDLRTARGRELLGELAAKADVFVENFRPGIMEKLGLGDDVLTAANARLIHCSITGFGQTGPYAHRAGYDFIIQGMAGLMSVTA